MQEKNIPSSKFAESLRDALDSSGLTQAELAARTGCTQPDISRYLSSGRMPSGDKLVAIALALGTTAEALVTGRGVAYNSVDSEADEAAAAALLLAARPSRGHKKLRRLVARVEEALKALREELDGE